MREEYNLSEMTFRKNPYEGEFIRLKFECYVCDKSHIEEDFNKSPEGWRKTWRGYLGHVWICDDCNILGRKKKSDMRK